MPLAVVGNVNVDLVMGPVAPWPVPGTEVIVAQDDLRAAGSAGTATLVWTALGHDHQVAGHTGDDALGAWLRAAFAPASRNWPVAGSATTVSVGLTHPDGERTFFTTRGHLADLTWPQVREALDWTRLGGGYLLLCGGFLMEALARDYDRLFDHAAALGIRTALDPGWPPAGWTGAVRAMALHWVARSDLLMLNAAETCALAGRSDPLDAAHHLRARMRDGSIVVVKLGAEGALALDPAGAVHRAAAPAVAVLDTIGAGDVFDAAFLAALARRHGPATALTQAVGAAATAISTRPRRYTAESPT